MERMATSRRRPPCFPPKPNNESPGEGREKRDSTHSRHLSQIINRDFAGMQETGGLAELGRVTRFSAACRQMTQSIAADGHSERSEIAGTLSVRR
jgi:hypothetical protein